MQSDEPSPVISANVGLPEEVLTKAYAEELLSRQDALQAEAYQLIKDTDLLTMLAHAGTPEHVGSSAAGLMVWRDLDFNVLSAHASPELAFETLQPLLASAHITKMQYFNETGIYAPTELNGDERYYFVIYYQTVPGQEWKIDISFWCSDAPRGQLPYLKYLAQHLTDEKRLAILWIKDIWHRSPIYNDKIGGIDIYTAVLEHNVRTPTQFERYLLKQGLKNVK